jgi:phosphopantothenoylcysteine decarboxylase / phosphopantothenate---cysteine ligase
VEATLTGKRILLGVSGGIAAYKAADLVRRLRDAQCHVRVVMTAGAREFVTPLTFQALSGEAVRTDLFDPAAEQAMGHIELARWADAIVVAPASADCIARLAHGHADDLLTTLVLASSAPLALVPAMNQQMWAHAATQANIAALSARGVHLFGPGVGDQACGEFGAGRMLEPLQIVAELRALYAPRVLDGRRVVISAGPTFEDIDPVRFIGNRSSGRMGFALAAAARDAGAHVRLVAGPVALATPPGVTRIDVRSAAEMLAAVDTACADADIYIGAAAIADYRPAAAASSKIKKGKAAMTLELVQTDDVLMRVAASAKRPFLVGFAAETDDVLAYARGKLERKNLDLIVANRVGVAGSGFEGDDNDITVLARDRDWPIGRGTKAHLARELVALIASRLANPPDRGA